MDQRNSSTENFTDASIDTFISFLPYWAVVLCYVIFCLIDIIGIFGNCMIIIAVAFSQKLQTSTNAFVTSLAVTDLLTCVVLCLGYIALALLSLTPRLNRICQFVAFVTYSSIGSSLYTLGAIGINRLMLITKPNLCRRIFTSWKLGILISIPWIIPSGCLLIALINGVGVVGFDPIDKECGKVNTHEKARDLDLIMFAVGFPVPFVAIIVSYTWTYIYVKKHFKTQKKHMVHLRTTSPNSSRNSKTFSKTTTSLCDFTSEITVQESAINVDKESAKNTAKTIRKCVTSRADPSVTRPNSRMQKISHQQIQITKKPVSGCLHIFYLFCTTCFCCFDWQTNTHCK